jgi:hypothetical protein
MAENLSSRAVRFGPTVESQLLSKAAVTYLNSAPLM